MLLISDGKKNVFWHVDLYDVKCVKIWNIKYYLLCDGEFQAGSH